MSERVRTKDSGALTGDARGGGKMRTLLICHEGARLDSVVLARWLASFSELAGMIVIRENRQRVERRLKREIKRVGLVRFFDVLAFRVYYKLKSAGADRKWEEEQIEALSRVYPPHGDDVPVLVTHSPNSAEAEAFIKEHRPDIMIARCKTLLKENIFSLARAGTFVMHPGVCPEYRNAHGCFWALAEDDAERVGMTLLRIDRGVDTGPVYGYYSYAFDAARESHIRIQHRVVLENLDALREKLIDIHAGRAVALDTTGRESATWGQPWLSRHFKIRRRARSGKARGGVEAHGERASDAKARDAKAMEAGAETTGGATAEGRS
ncbi:MAG TPA: formyltransferase family protein [Pyrinomonadaceae bacterium]|nr:formyltransferase family protein [Pyrinomonadaceae bacterium]